MAVLVIDDAGTDRAAAGRRVRQIESARRAATDDRQIRRAARVLRAAVELGLVTVDEILTAVTREADR